MKASSRKYLFFTDGSSQRSPPDNVKTITLSYTLFDVTETGVIAVDSLASR